MDSDHFLVMAKIRARISTHRRHPNKTPPKLDVEKLQSPQLAKEYADSISKKIQELPVGHVLTVNEQWTQCANIIKSAAEETIGFRPPPRRNPWFDDECKHITDDKNTAYLIWLQRRTRHAYAEYSRLRGEQRRLLWRKQKAYEDEQFLILDGLKDRNEVRKFYQKINAMTQGFKPRTNVCKDKQGNLITEPDDILKRWSEYFMELLKGDRTTRSIALFEADHDPLNTENLTPPTFEEVRISIQSLKNNKSPGSDGLAAELFKAGGDNLVGCMHQIMVRIWKEECMPDEWNKSIICPIFKKGDRLECSNYRGISLLNVAYKILSKIICLRLKPYMEYNIGKYQCGFRPGKSTTDQIFTLRQILEKTREFNITTHHLFVDFKAAYDSIERDELLQAMIDFGYPAKLVNLCRMTLACTICAVRADNKLSGIFQTFRGFRQGDQISCDLFNIALEKTIRQAGVDTRGTIYHKSTQLLGYADDLDIIGRTQRNVCEAFSAIEESAKLLGLKVNETKTKYMVATTNDAPRHRVGQNVTVGEYNLEVVKDFVYLGCIINADGDNTSLEIKRRIVLANRCFYGLNRHMKSKTLSRRSKLTLYRTLIAPVLLYGSESWTISSSDETRLGAFERKILRKILGPTNVNGVWRQRYNHELYELYDDVDLVKRVRINRLRWLGHLVRMENNTPAKVVFDSGPEGKRRRGRPNLRWKDGVEADVRLLNLPENWRQAAQNRILWRNSLASA